MTYKYYYHCRKCRLFVIFMLLFQQNFAQYNFTKIDSWLHDNLNNLGGRAVLVIYKDGKIIYHNALNEMSRKQKLVAHFIAKRKNVDADELLQDFTSTTKERIASSSKWLSAALVMTFVDEGQLNLTDSIGKYLPVMTAHGKGNIKIGQCLSHLTGIQSGSLKESITALSQVKSMDEAMEQIAGLPMEGLPGKVFHYSNTGLQIAGAVIEKISGQNFETLFNEKIAKPCNMLQTDFGHAKVAMPAGGAWSTAEDYINFLQMILQEGYFNGKQILSKKSIAEMQKNYISKDVTIAYSPAEAGNWGYGFGEWTMSGTTHTENNYAVSSPGLFGSFPWVDNKLHYAAFLMTLNLKSKGRHELYTTLKQLIDTALSVNP